MSEDVASARTLFDIDWYDLDRCVRDNWSYWMQLERSRDDIDESELSIFLHVMEHEIRCYESRGFFSGPIVIETTYPSPYTERSSTIIGASLIPTVVSEDCVRIRECTASCVLLVEDTYVFKQIANSLALKERNVLLIACGGVPRLSVREFLARLNQELNLPVYLLVDNDTWGYFIYALLLRGAMGPHASFPWASLNDVTFIGLRARDCLSCDVYRPWKKQWHARLRALRQYKCFEESHWQDELQEFEDLGRGTNLRDVVVSRGGIEGLVNDIILPQI